MVYLRRVVLVICLDNLARDYMLNSETQSGADSLNLSHAESDALFSVVSEQLSLNTFNSDDQELIKRMVESMGDSRGMVRLSFAEALGKSANQQPLY